jgi:hypothetical protein
MPASQSNNIMSGPNNQLTSNTSNLTTQRSNAHPTGNGEFNHDIGPPSTFASTILPRMTDRDRMEIGLENSDHAIDPSNQTGQSTSPTAARNRTLNGTSGEPQEPLYLANFTSRRENVHSQGRDSTPSASMDEFFRISWDATVRVPADTPNTRTPNNTPQQSDAPRTVNGEGNGRDHRAEENASNNASHDQPTPTNIDRYLHDVSAEENRRLEETTNSRNNEPLVCMSEFWTLSSNGFDPFHTDSSESPVAAVTENPVLFGAPQTNHSNPQADNFGNFGVFNVASFGNTTPATHRVTNERVPNRDRQARRNISNSTLGEEERPTRLSDYLPQDDPATQEQWHNAWMTALSGHASDPIRHPDTLLPNGDVENCNALAQGSLDDVPLVYMSDLQSRTPSRERLAGLVLYSEYSEDEASSTAPGEETTAGSQANPTNPIRRRHLTPLADNDPSSTRVANGGVRNHNRRAVRPVESLRRTTSEENRIFWREFNDPENDTGST